MSACVSHTAAQGIAGPGLVVRQESSSTFPLLARSANVPESVVKPPVRFDSTSRAILHLSKYNNMSAKDDLLMKT